MAIYRMILPARRLNPNYRDWLDALTGFLSAWLGVFARELPSTIRPYGLVH